MSEYRPFPTDPLPHDDGEIDAHDHDGHGHDGHDHDEAHDGQFQGRPPRPAPNTEHPGGHLGGTVARLNRPRRFGFIRIEEGTEVFFHASAIDSGPHAFDALRTGQEVEVTCHQDEGGRGLAASVVTVIGAPPEVAPRPVRPPRPERIERVERVERPERVAPARPMRQSTMGGWHVAVLRDRYDMAVPAQLQRLLNERHVRPGNFTLALKDGQDGTSECWVVYHTGD